jgi:hypothetical protein
MPSLTELQQLLTEREANAGFWLCSLQYTGALVNIGLQSMGGDTQLALSTLLLAAYSMVPY